MPLLKRYNAYKVLQEVMSSKTSRGFERYQKKHEGNTIYVRAVYGRRMERVSSLKSNGILWLIPECLHTGIMDLAASFHPLYYVLFIEMVMFKKTDILET